MHRRGDNAKRLSNAERLDIRRRVAEGETFEAAAVAVGCSTKSIQRLIARSGGMRPRFGAEAATFGCTCTLMMGAMARCPVAPSQSVGGSNE